MKNAVRVMDIYHVTENIRRMNKLKITEADVYK